MTFAYITGSRVKSEVVSLERTRPISGPWCARAAWLSGCIVAAIAVSEFIEDKGNQTPFVSGAFYLLSGIVRLLIRAWRNRG